VPKNEEKATSRHLIKTFSIAINDILAKGTPLEPGIIFKCLFSINRWFAGAKINTSRFILSSSKNLKSLLPGTQPDVIYLS
jgi:hypothetical protein